MEFKDYQEPSIGAENLNKMQKELLNKLNPVGHIRLETTDINPATYLGFGTWTLWGQGRVPVGVDTTQEEFNAVEKIGGEKTHKLTIDEMPRHSGHVNGITTGVPQPGDGIIMTANPVEVGNNMPHNNLQPYITCYMWKRTA